WRPPSPNAVTSSSVSRTMMRTRLFWPSAKKTNRCSGSLENAMSQAEPEPNVFLAKNASFTNVPSGRNTCTRSLVRSHVDQSVIRPLDTVHRVAELLRRRRFRIVVSEFGIVWPVAVSAPIAFHLSGIGVDHGHALVEIAVRDVGLVGHRIDPDLGDPPE